MVKNEEKARNEDAKIERQIKRKQDKPVANRKDFQRENERMGVNNPVDLLLGEEGEGNARKKYDR